MQKDQEGDAAEQKDESKVEKKTVKRARQSKAAVVGGSLANPEF